MQKRFMLFEEFNKLTGKEFVEKLVIFAKGSSTPTSVSEIEENSSSYTFTIFTDIPGENEEGTKSFLVKIPTDNVSRASVTTLVNGRKTFFENLEPEGENDINVILKNYVEATDLYDDNAVEILTSSYNRIESVEDIRRIIQGKIV